MRTKPLPSPIRQARRTNGTAEPAPGLAALYPKQETNDPVGVNTMRKDSKNTDEVIRIAVNRAMRYVENEIGVRPTLVDFGRPTCKCPTSRLHNKKGHDLGFAVRDSTHFYSYCAYCARRFYCFKHYRNEPQGSSETKSTGADVAPQPEPISYGDNVIAFPNRKQRDDLRTGI